LSLPPRLRRRLGASALSFLLALLLAEGAVRLLGPSLGLDPERVAAYRAFVRDGVSDYEPRPHTVFARTRGRGPLFNSQGFTSHEWSLEKRPGTLRILCLGGSTTEGGNQYLEDGSYPGMLERELREGLGVPVEVMNAGISGWTTAETTVAWFLILQDYRPDLVIVHHAINDSRPRSWPGFQPDYSHWRKPWDPPRHGALHRLLARWSDLYVALVLERKLPDVESITTLPLRGRLERGPDGWMDPATAAPFERNVRSIGESAERNGAAVALMTMPLDPDTQTGAKELVYGTHEHNEILRELCREHGWILMDAERELPLDRRSRGAFVDICHLLPRGNLIKAQVATRALLRDWAPLRERVADATESE